MATRKGSKHSFEHRAAIAASVALSHDGLTKEQDPDRWQKEYEYALFRMRKRAELFKKAKSHARNRPS